MFVSVILAAYNDGPYIAEAIDSVLNQTHSDFELILIDDGSTDDTLAIMRHFESLDERIIVLAREHTGVGAARNAGIAIARGEWIVGMDGDDIMEPYRIERQLAFVTEHPGLVLTSNCVTFIDRHGKILGRNQPRLTTDDEVAEALKRDVILGMHHTMARKDVILQSGGYRQEMWPAEDTELWTRIADAGGRVLTQPEHLTRYRIHDQSTVVRNRWRIQRHQNWIVQCVLNRRAGLPEPTFDEFIEQHNSMRRLQRWNLARREFGAALYKEARFTYATGRIVRTALMLMASSILMPSYAPFAFWRVIVRPRLPWGSAERLAQQKT